MQNIIFVHAEHCHAGTYMNFVNSLPLLKHEHY
jgi:hypothetical protein